jgi:hypothetical protein
MQEYEELRSRWAEKIQNNLELIFERNVYDSWVLMCWSDYKKEILWIDFHKEHNAY